MSFVWRTTASSADEIPFTTSARAALGIRIAITSILGLGGVYFIAMARTFTRYGEEMDRKWRRMVRDWMPAQSAPPGYSSHPMFGHGRSGRTGHVIPPVVIPTLPQPFVPPMPGPATVRVAPPYAPATYPGSVVAPHPVYPAPPPQIIIQRSRSRSRSNDETSPRRGRRHRRGRNEPGYPDATAPITIVPPPRSRSRSRSSSRTHRRSRRRRSRSPPYGGETTLVSLPLRSTNLIPEWWRPPEMQAGLELPSIQRRHGRNRVPPFSPARILELRRDTSVSMLLPLGVESRGIPHQTWQYFMDDLSGEVSISKPMYPSLWLKITIYFQYRCFVGSLRWTTTSRELTRCLSKIACFTTSRNGGTPQIS
jgi:hypothetical protein